jgi:8-amino-7-oxononanoate synthase
LSDKDTKFSFIDDALELRVQEHKLRKLHSVTRSNERTQIDVDGDSYINFSSNDYLGLSYHPKLIERSNEFSKKYGVGAGASRLITGSLDIHMELEKKLAYLFGTEAAILFNSGFQANTSILPALADRNSLILADKNIHNSLIQGSLLSKAHFKRFRHNDYKHLKSLLRDSVKKNYNRIWIVSETVFSMDGDQCDIDALIELANKYKALLYSDDAHALGVLGESGLGLNFGKSGIDISLGTFGKSFGSFGAFATCSKRMKEYLVNFSSGFIYSTALPPAILGAIDAGLDIVPTMEDERITLFQNVEYLKEQLVKLGYDLLESNSQIIPVLIGSEKEVINISNLLKENKLWISAIRPPTVESNASRLRITLSVHHTAQQIDKLLKVFRDWKKK